MQAFVSVSMIVVFVVLVVIPSDVESQSSAANKFIEATTKLCRPECSVWKISSTIRAAAGAALKKHSVFERRISGLQSQNKLKSSKKHGCPCNSCKAKKELLFRCGKCYIYRPKNGLVNINCVKPNKKCKVSCGCTGRCRMHGPAFRWVLLYCPHKKPIPWRPKKVKVCTNCCCVN